jgi:hypothetical protein
MPSKDRGWITFQLPKAEGQMLERYCEQMQRSKTDVLRQLVRTLDREMPTAIATRKCDRCSNLSLIFRRYLLPNTRFGNLAELFEFGWV